MTLDEAIRLEEGKAEHYYEMADDFHTDEGVYNREESAYRTSAEEHEQLASFLRELKNFRDGAIRVDWICNYINACKMVGTGKLAARLSAEAVSAMVDMWQEEQKGN